MRCQDKKHWLFFILWICLLCLWIVGCAVENGGSALSTETSVTPSAAAVTSTVTVTASPTMTPLPTSTYTTTPVPIVLPSVTMSPQEAEDALQELLKTNGNCTGKCLAGIRPDEMTVQEAVDQMARWGMLSMDEDNNGRTFVHAIPPTLHDKQTRVNLVLIWREQAVSSVSFHIPRYGDSELGADVWLANREAWKAFQFGNLLKVYGIPSYVGFLLQSGDPENGTVAYTLDIQYEQMNLDMGTGGYAHWNGQNLFICPSKDPHDLGININPEASLGVSLRKLQQASPITWQALTSGDLQSFYQMFTDESNPDACVTTTLKKIIELDPTFR